MDLATLVIGGLIGFLSAIGKDFILENNKKKAKIKDFKRQKLEEIFILMDKVSQETIKPLKYKNSLDGVGAKLGMIVRFYFPELNDDYDIFLKVFQTIYQKTITLDENISLTTEEIATHYKAHQVFINKIVEESKRYA
ncbi:MAG: hypothetical protein PHI38_05995 [Sulfurimonas sp.]|jgi:hypothetical protein|uniref:hypothetical protein n=1 Tax=Sulfurimonas sp. TaxID=2022749 RepID=UPI00260C5454|nr:hypothetical protein [Sulfurimonas sp.]MDD3476400.1 hypothetical protein [Sulfurimonas sp.]